MGIKVEADSVLVNCFTCGFKAGQLSFLYRRLCHHDSSWREALEACLNMESEYLIDGVTYLGNVGYLKSIKPTLEPIDESMWEPYGRSFCRYFESRGITFETGAAWGVGHDKSKSRVLVPVRDQRGALWGAVGRTYKDERPKYMNYFDMSKGEHLLGAHMIGRAKSIVVVEGALDAMRAYQALKGKGLDSDYACVSVMGSSVSQAQIKRLVACAHEVILALDNDEAGSRGRAKADEDLSKLLMLRHANLNSVGKNDFGECSEEEILGIILGAELKLF
jgi:5S rRNA maturation endonuclease (ribonuclease M5)